jgi:hypothetical protein
MRDLVLFLALAASGCADRVAVLQPAAPSRDVTPKASVLLGRITDARGEGDVIAHGRDGFLGVAYDVEASGPVAPWLEDHVRAALGSGGLTSGSPTATQELAVRVVRFELTGSTWVHGTGVFDVALYDRRSRNGGLRAAKRLVVRTTDLATEDDDEAWSGHATRLARWSAVEIARWTSAALADETP